MCTQMRLLRKITYCEFSEFFQEKKSTYNPTYVMYRVDCPGRVMILYKMLKSKHINFALTIREKYLKIFQTARQVFAFYYLLQFVNMYFYIYNYWPTTPQYYMYFDKIFPSVCNPLKVQTYSSLPLFKI